MQTGPKCVISLLLAGIVHFASAKLPPYIKVCKSNEPNIVGCIMNSVNELKPKLIEGIPELNVPPLEPLHLDVIKLRSGPRTTKIDANITNIKVHGASNFEVVQLKPNVARAKFAFKIRLPFLSFEGNYDIDMNFLLLRYNGEGLINGNFTNYSADCILRGNKIRKGTEEYLKFEKMRIRLIYGKSKLYLSDLFKNDPILGRATNEVINENTEIFLTEIRPVLENSLAEKFTDIANKITLKFTYAELFP